jgi:putative membrane protein
MIRMLIRVGIHLLANAIGLLITTWVSGGLKIEGVKTWLLATLIVWLAALLADLILPVLLVRKAVDQTA